MTRPLADPHSPRVPKRRRPRGSGAIFKIRRTWWIAYRAADGRRVKESSHSLRKGDAERLLDSRNGGPIHRLPVIKNSDLVTFNDAAQAVKDDFSINKKKSAAVLTRRIDKHLTPFFGGCRLASITPADVTAYVAHRQAQGIQQMKVVPTADGKTERKLVRVSDVSNSEINRELQTLKRIFNLAIEQARVAMKPTIKMLAEPAAPAGFFEAEQLARVLAHLPSEIQPIIRFAAITGWRIASEVLPLEWRQVDFAAGEVRLDAGTTKNNEGRVFPFTAEVRDLLKARQRAHARLKKAGHLVPQVFWRMVADGRGGDKKPKSIVRFNKAWKNACVAAGCPGRIPHDLRRSPVRAFVRAGISEHTAMALSGHKTASVFRRYDIISDGDLREAAARLDATLTGISRSAAQ